MFEKVRYPDGQITAKVKEFPKQITARINNYEDLMFVRSVAEVYKYQGRKAVLFIPCLFGQRSDRRFEEQQSFDLKLITDDINSCKFERVLLFDPHSDISMALINNSHKISPFSFVEEAVNDIRKYKVNWPQEDILLVSPDAGAYKKVFEFGEKLKIPVVAAVKYRNLDGKVDLTFMGEVKDKDCLIIDDLCDGGYTFEVLGKKLKEQGARSVYLYVSHGYFSKGFSKLHEAGIEKIYCTNSVKDLEKWSVEDGKVFTTNNINDYVKQFKVV